MNWVSYIFLTALGLSIIVQLWLDNRHTRHVRLHRDAVPEAFSENIKLEAHQKAADYTLAKVNSGFFDMLISTILLLFWTLGGGLEWLDTSLRTFELSAVYTGILVILSLMLISGIVDLPMSLYRTFVLEQRFGFNRMTLGLFIADIFKNLIVSLLIGAPLIFVVLWLMEDANQFWWIYVWAVWMGFSLLMMWAWPAFIAPIFNKFEPLEDASLKQQIEDLLQRCGFKSNGVFVMDGSKRSSHGNAYFSGLGANKRIVFFDTLLKSLKADEVEAVLAHELGHFKRKHIQKRILSMALLSLISLAILAWLLTLPEFFNGLGVSHPSTYMGLILFMMVIPLFNLYLHPLMSYFSRKHEFEADEYAAKQSDAKNLISALVKLYEENANTLTPDPLYSAFHDSHPPAPVRIAHLAKA